MKAGQVYRVPREGKPAHHVKVLRVAGKKTHQPKIHYVLVTKSGKRKPLGSGLTHLVTWMTWDGKAWSPPGVWQLVN